MSSARSSAGSAFSNGSFARGNGFESEISPEDLFNMFFGGGMNGGGGGGFGGMPGMEGLGGGGFGGMPGMEGLGGAGGMDIQKVRCLLC